MDDVSHQYSCHVPTEVYGCLSPHETWAQLKADTNNLGARMESVEQRLDETLPAISMLQDKGHAQDQKIEAVSVRRF